MSESQPSRRHHANPEDAQAMTEGPRPTTDQPLNAAPRPRFTPLLLTALILVVAVAIIIGVGFI